MALTKAGNKILGQLRLVDQGHYPGRRQVRRGREWASITLTTPIGLVF